MKPQSVVLKEQLVLERTKADSLSSVRNLNLWGEGFTDVSIVEKIPRIEVLALAANQLTTLRPFASCTLLRELYLRKNDIKSLAEIRHIKDLPNLHTLWLMDNPCAKNPEYRSFVIFCCEHLRQLDDIEVTEQEREEAKRRLSKSTVLEILNCGGSSGDDGHGKLGVDGRLAPVVTQQRLSRDIAGGGNVGAEVSRGHPSAAVVRGGVHYAAGQTQRAILNAILSLISELTLESLDLLREEVNGEVWRRERAVQQRARGQ